MKRSVLAALCAAMLCSYAYAGERPFAARAEAVVVPAPEPVLVDFDAARAERIRLWQAELAAREREIERAQTAWLPPRVIGPITENVVRDRSTFGDYLVTAVGSIVPAPTYVVDWRLAERRWFAYRPYPYPTAPVIGQPGYLVTTPPTATDLVASPRIERDIVRPIGGTQAEVISVRAARPPEFGWR